MLADLLITGLCAAAIAAPPPSAKPAAASPSGVGITAVHAGRIITGTGADIKDGILLIRDGRVIEVGPASKIKVPAGARIIDARSGIAIPGLVAAYSAPLEADAAESVSPDARAIDGYDFTASGKKLLQSGITSLYLSTPAHRLLAGQGGVVKPGGAIAGSRSARTVRASADLRVVIGDAVHSAPALFRPAIPPTTENPLLPAQRPLITTVPSQFAVLRQLFADARAAILFPNAVRSAGIGAPDADRHPAERKTKLAPLVDILRGTYPLRIHADTVSEIRASLRFAAEQRIPIVLEGVAEGGTIAAEIAARHVPVVASTPIDPAASIGEDLARESLSGKKSADNIARLVHAGVKTALMPASGSLLNDLLGAAAAQVGQGLTPQEALGLITRSAAETLGVSSRVGTLEKGKDADILVLSGEPLAGGSHVELALVNGKLAYEHGDASAAGLTAIRVKRVYTVSHGIIENGVVLVRGGKIVGIRTDGEVPPGAKLIDKPGSTIIPGIIDSGSYLGLHTDSEPIPAVPGAPVAGPISGKTRLYMALRAHDPALAEALASGVTSILLSPPASGAISGTASLLKTVDAPDSTDGPKSRVVRDAAAIVFNAVGGSPRMAQPWALEEMLAGAKSYLQRRTLYVREHKQWEVDRDEARRLKKELPAEPQEVAQDEDMDALLGLFKHDIPALVHASRSDEILNALKAFRDGADLPVTLFGAADAYRIPEDLRKRGVSVASGPGVLRADHGATINTAAVLADAGVKVILQSGSASGTRFLRLNAASAARQGLNPQDALRAITLSPAEALHVEGRLGSIDSGKDADLVILSGDPLELTSHVEAVFVDGKLVYDGKSVH